MDIDRRLVSSGLVSVADAATFLGVSRAHVYNLMERGVLRYAKLGKARRVPKEALVELAARSLTREAANDGGHVPEVVRPSTKRSRPLPRPDQLGD
jgi:excisionase family DNA binding protein